MRFLKRSDLPQVYSFSPLPKPEQFWAFPVVSEGKLEAVQGIPQQVLNKAQDLSQHWTGWGFGSIGTDRAFLLFENHEDAVFANLHIGEILNDVY